MEIEKGAGKLTKALSLLIPDKSGYLGRITTAIGMGGSNVGDIHIVRIGLTHNTQEMTTYVDSEEHLARMPATDYAGFGWRASAAVAVGAAGGNFYRESYHFAAFVEGTRHEAFCCTLLPPAVHREFRSCGREGGRLPDR